MKRILQMWLIPILLVLMLVGMACVLVPFDRQQEEKAKQELSSLVDNAFLRMAAMEETGEPETEAALERLLLQARAVARILAHDDTLLESEALAAMGVQLGLDQIDVCGLEGTLSASSDPTRIGRAVVGDPAYAWTQSVTDDPLSTATQVDKQTAGLLQACTAREDADGFVLVSRMDAYVASLSQRADAQSVTSDMAYGQDLLFQTAAGDEDGFFIDKNCLCLRRTQGDVSLIAARPLTEVHAVRKAALLVLAGCALAALICGLAYYILHLEPVTESEKTCVDDPAPEREPTPPSFLPETGGETAAEAETERTEAPTVHARADRKRKRTAGAPETVQPPSPRRPRRPKRRTEKAETTQGEQAETQQDEPHDDEGFDKVFD